jgi:hypothetical protein
LFFKIYTVSDKNTTMNGCSMNSPISKSDVIASNKDISTWIILGYAVILQSNITFGRQAPVNLIIRLIEVTKDKSIKISCNA